MCTHSRLMSTGPGRSAFHPRNISWTKSFVGWISGLDVVLRGIDAGLVLRRPLRTSRPARGRAISDRGSGEAEADRVNEGRAKEASLAPPICAGRAPLEISDAEGELETPASCNRRFNSAVYVVQQSETFSSGFKDPQTCSSSCLIFSAGFTDSDSVRPSMGS